MMNLINAEHISMAYDERSLLHNADFSLGEGEKVGVIGINGTGKSTLLKIIGGLEEPDVGTVTKANNLVIRYLPQHPAFAPGETVLSAVLRDITDEAERYVAEAEAKSMLTKLLFTDFAEEVAHLSGGQRKRLALVQTLLAKADVLLLDEPTNHLDAEMTEWLEEYLKNYRGALVMVTHDRYFLDSVTNRIVEVDKGQIFSYKANYQGFLQLKVEREEMQRAGERKRLSILKTEIAWMQRGARARSTKQKAHIQRYERLAEQKGIEEEASLEMSSVYSRMGKTTVSLENVSKSYGDRVLMRDFTYHFLKNDRVGIVGRNGCGKTTLLRILTGTETPDSGTIEIGQTVKIGYYAQEISHETVRGSRAVGAVPRMTEEVRDGQAEQNGASAPRAHALAVMDPEKRVIDFIRDTAEYVQTEDGPVSASVMLERFLFPAEKQYAKIGKLSGGEKRRLNLLRVLMEAPNVLILDEPTNDLDIRTLTILEDYLDHFAGIVIIVSHDRYLLDRTVRRIFAFEDDGVVRQYEGGYTDYRAKKEAEEAEAAGGSSTTGRGGKGSSTSASGKANGSKSVGEDGTPGSSGDSGTKGKKTVVGITERVRFTFAEQREYDTIEDDISALEEKIAETEAEIAKNASNYGKLTELTAQKEALEEQLLQKMERWEYLSEKAEKMKK